MTAAMSKGSAGKFPFASELREGEVAGVQHIRDHSNYLFPQGLLNLFGNIAVYMRGLMANALLLLPLLLLAAAFTIWSNPDVQSLTKTNVGSYLVHLPISVDHFGLTLNALLILVSLLTLWALWRSTSWGRNISDVAFGSRFVGSLLAAILITAFFELQPLLLSGMFKAAGGGSLFTAASSSLQALAALLAPVGVIVGFLGSFLANVLKRTTEKPGFMAFATGIIIKLAMYVAGAAVPIALWVAYLYLSFWGIKDCPTSASCIDHTPEWLTFLARCRPFPDGSVLALYVPVGLALLLIGWLLSPNANSLHRLYRDRLGKAFLFDPTLRTAADAWSRLRGQTGREAEASLTNSDLAPLDHLRMSELNCDLAPYHLINAALNIEASKFAVGEAATPTSSSSARSSSAARQPAMLKPRPWNT